jgi:hypothetical protein
VHLMPGGAQLIHVAKSEKDVFFAVIALYKALYRHWRCLYGGSRFSTKERPVH